MAEKRVVVHLKDGNSAQSEYMSDDAAQAEFERILGENPTEGEGHRIIRVGKSAAFKAGDFSRIELRSKPFVGVV